MICDWSDKKSCLVQYWMLKINVRHWMEVVEFRSVLSIKQSNW